MLIAFDGACFADGPPTGVARAFCTGLTAYAARGAADCVLLVPAGANAPALAGVRVVAAPRGAWRRQLQLPGLLRALGADLLHSSVAAVPLRAACPTIATVHDLPWRHPQLHEPVSAWRRWATRRALRSATAVIAPSTLTRDDTAALLGAKAPRLRVVPHGTALGEAPTAATTAARRGPFLVLGDDRPRKNRARLRRAHALARAKANGLPDLQFAGPPDAYVDEAEKVRRLRSCRALVHVSRFEGFGLPVLEGLAHGAPVLCSALAPHHEIAGPHALFVDPDDDAAIAAALLRLHADEALRWQLAAAGHARAARFSPAAVAEAWANLHHEVLA